MNSDPTLNAYELQTQGNALIDLNLYLFVNEAQNIFSNYKSIFEADGCVNWDYIKRI